MQPQPIIETDRLILRPVEPADCTETYLSWLNDYEVVQYTDSCFIKHTMNSLMGFVNAQIKNDNSVFLSIRLKENNKHIGNIKIDQIHPYHNAGEYGILMGDRSEWGKGYGKEASIAIVKYVFNELDLHKVNLAVVEQNARAVQLYRSMGFVQEGHLRECFFHLQSRVFMNGLKFGLLQKESTL